MLYLSKYNVNSIFLSVFEAVRDNTFRTQKARSSAIRDHLGTKSKIKNSGNNDLMCAMWRLHIIFTLALLLAANCARAELSKEQQLESHLRLFKKLLTVNSSQLEYVKLIIDARLPKTELFTSDLVLLASEADAERSTTQLYSEITAATNLDTSTLTAKADNAFNSLAVLEWRKDMAEASATQPTYVTVTVTSLIHHETHPPDPAAGAKIEQLLELLLQKLTEASAILSTATSLVIRSTSSPTYEVSDGNSEDDFDIETTDYPAVSEVVEVTHTGEGHEITFDTNTDTLIMGDTLVETKPTRTTLDQIVQHEHTNMNKALNMKKAGNQISVNPQFAHHNPATAAKSGKYGKPKVPWYGTKAPLMRRPETLTNINADEVLSFLRKVIPETKDSPSQSPAGEDTLNLHGSSNVLVARIDESIKVRHHRKHHSHLRRKERPLFAQFAIANVAVVLLPSIIGAVMFALCVTLL